MVLPFGVHCPVWAEFACEAPYSVTKHMVPEPLFVAGPDKEANKQKQASLRAAIDGEVAEVKAVIRRESARGNHAKAWRLWTTAVEKGAGQEAARSGIHVSVRSANEDVVCKDGAGGEVGNVGCSARLREELRAARRIQELAARVGADIAGSNGARRCNWTVAMLNAWDKVKMNPAIHHIEPAQLDLPYRSQAAAYVVLRRAANAASGAVENEG